MRYTIKDQVTSDTFYVATSIHEYSIVESIKQTIDKLSSYDFHIIVDAVIDEGAEQTLLNKFNLFTAIPITCAQTVVISMQLFASCLNNKDILMQLLSELLADNRVAVMYGHRVAKSFIITTETGWGRLSVTALPVNQSRNAYFVRTDRQVVINLALPLVYNRSCSQKLPPEKLALLKNLINAEEVIPNDI